MTGKHPQALVLGGRGYLGQRIIEASGGDYWALPVGRVVDDASLVAFAAQVDSAMQAHPNACIVNAIGLRHGSAQALTFANALVPDVIARAAVLRKSWVVHLGSAAELTADIPATSIATLREMDGTYAESKRRGADACLQTSRVTALRVFNIHGLPHQESGGLHRLCKAVRAATVGDSVETIVNTTRDYVHWLQVVEAVRRAVEEREGGLIEVCSGIGLSMSDFVEGLPRALGESLRPHIVQPDCVPSVVGSPPGDACGEDPRDQLLREIRSEVMRCAYS